VRRPILKSVNISQQDNQCTAEVILEGEQQQFIGRASTPLGDDHLTAIALATLGALSQYIPIKVDFNLKKIAKMQPEALNNYLLIVMVEATSQTEHFSLTGTCLSEEATIINSAANAESTSLNNLESARGEILH
jgi:hypothetical protein